MMERLFLPTPVGTPPGRGQHSIPIEAIRRTGSRIAALHLRKTVLHRNNDNGIACNEAGAAGFCQREILVAVLDRKRIAFAHHAAQGPGKIILRLAGRIPHHAIHDQAAHALRPERIVEHRAQNENQHIEQHHPLHRQVKLHGGPEREHQHRQPRKELRIAEHIEHQQRKADGQHPVQEGAVGDAEEIGKNKCLSHSRRYQRLRSTTAGTLLGRYTVDAGLVEIVA